MRNQRNVPIGQGAVRPQNIAIADYEEGFRVVAYALVSALFITV
ncbi:MAG: hypothetical protein ACJ8IR_13860 [Alphaproteobacteria bacterium]